MAGDEGSTKHEPVGQWGTGYQGHVTQLNFTPVRYADYSPMLSAIENAGSNILNYLNPRTIAQMKFDIAQSQEGRDWLDWVQRPENRDRYYSTQMGIQGGRLEAIPGYTNPYMQVGPISDKSKTGDDNPPAKVNPTTVPPQSNTGDNPPQNSPTTSGDTTSVPQKKNPYDFFSGNDGTSLHFQQGGPVPWYQETHFGGQGVPQPPPAAQPQVTPSPQTIQPARTPTFFAGQPAENTMFTAPNQVPAPPMPAQVQQPGALPAHIPYSPEGQTAALNPTVGAPLNPQEIARRQAEQQNLISWQNQNQGGILSASEARDWAKNAIDTDITRAVYLPRGGPQGAPAYAFYGKKAGAANIVPVSQMVKAGAGPLVAAQNITQMLSAGDQQNQPQTAAATPPQIGGGNAAVNPGPAWSPFGNQVPFPAGAAAPRIPLQPNPGGAPPAPTGPNVAGQLPQDEFARRVAAATNVPNAGGPPASQLFAGNEAGAVNTAGGQSGPTDNYDQNEVKKFEQDYKANGSKYTNDWGDPYIGTSANNGWHWYKSDHGTGISYVEWPGAGGFQRTRQYLGIPGTQTIVPPPQAMREELFKAMPQLGYETIQNMGKEELQDHLAKYWNMKNLNPMSDPKNQILDEERQQILNGQRVLDATQGHDPQEFNQSAQQTQNLVRQGKGLFTKNPQNLLQNFNNLLAMGLGVLTGGSKESSRLNFVNSNYDDLLHRQLGLAPGAPMTDAQRADADRSMGGMYSGSPDFRAVLQQKVNNWKASLRQHILQSVANNEKIAQLYTDMNDDMTHGRPLWDKDAWSEDKGGPAEKGKPGSGVANEGLQTASGTRANPSATPPPAPSATPAAPVKTGPGSSEDNPILIHSNEQYYGSHGVWVTDGHSKPRYRP